jgi:hypothetical protein
LRNTEFRHAPAGEIPAECDYIAVADFTRMHARNRAALLEAVRAALRPNGVAVLAVDTLPGAHFRAMMREILLDHAGARESGAPLHQAALELTAMQATGLNLEQPLSPYLKAFHQEIADLTAGDLERLYLADFFEPIYLHEFQKLLLQAGLEYLGDAGFDNASEDDLQPGAWNHLRELSRSDRIRFEQYLDFATGRLVRHALVSATPAPLQGDRELQGLWAVAGTAAEELAAAGPGAGRIAAAAPRALPLSETGVPWQQARALFARSAIELRTSPTVSEPLQPQPRAFPLARHQAATGCSHAATPLLSLVPLTDLRRGLLHLADGKRMRVEIEAEIMKLGSGGTPAQWRQLLENEFRLLERSGLFTR